jgi:hypothetical protein
MHASSEESTEVLFTRQDGAAGQTASASASLAGTDGGGSPSGKACLARARHMAAKRLAAARRKHGPAKLRARRAALRRERKAIARCRSPRSR